MTFLLYRVHNYSSFSDAIWNVKHLACEFQRSFLTTTADLWEFMEENVSKYFSTHSFIAVDTMMVT